MVNKRKARPSVGSTDEASSYPTSFNIHQCFEDYKSNWQDSPLSAVYGRNPTLTEGFSDIFVVDDPDLFSQISQIEQFFLRSYEWISIDKIAVLFDVPAINRNNEFCRYYWRRFRGLIDKSRILIKNPTPLYRHSCVYFDDFYMQWGSEKGNTLRIEFNPNNADLKMLVPLFTIFSEYKEHALFSARVSRLDIAVDYALYLNPLSWYISLLSVWNKYGVKSDIQTLNYGAPTSDRKIRIYDKKAEIFKKNDVDIGLDYWRVESEVKGIKGSSFGLFDYKLIFNNDPFNGLSYYDQFSFELKGQGTYNLFVLACRAFGVDFACSQLDYRTRKKYLDRLRSDSVSLPFNLPSAIYKNCFPVIYKNFVQKLKKFFDLGRELYIESPENPAMKRDIEKGLKKC
jgi:hypothetical protein